MKIILVFLASLFICLLYFMKPFLPFALLAFCLYLLFLFKYPEIALFITILVTTNVFSLMSEDFMRLPGAFRIKDIFFISAFIPLAFALYRKKLRFDITPLFKAIWVIMFFVLIEFLFTVFIKDQGLNYTIRIARRYLYYLLYFPLVYLIDDEKKFRRFLFLIVGSSAVFSVLMIAQYLIGPSVVIFKYASSVGIQEIAGERVTRSYALGGGLAIIVFFMYIFRLFYGEGNKFANLAMALLMFLGGVYLGFSRANLFGVITGGALASFILLSTGKKIKALIISFTVILLLFLLFEGIGVFSVKQSPNPVSLSYKSLVKGADDLVNKTGTVGFRLKDSAARIELIKENFLIGVGFVHPESQIIRIRTLHAGITTGDSGLITLLLDFGLMGAIWLIFLSAAFFRESRRVFGQSKNIPVKILALAAFSFYFSRLFSFLTLTDFVDYDGITYICIVSFIVAFLGKSLKNERLKSGLIGNNSKL